MSKESVPRSEYAPAASNQFEGAMVCLGCWRSAWTSLDIFRCQPSCSGLAVSYAFIWTGYHCGAPCCSSCFYKANGRKQQSVTHCNLCWALTADDDYIKQCEDDNLLVLFRKQVRALLSSLLGACNV